MSNNYHEHRSVFWVFCTLSFTLRGLAVERSRATLALGFAPCVLSVDLRP